jgi:hypothetical protein
MSTGHYGGGLVGGLGGGGSGGSGVGAGGSSIVGVGVAQLFGGQVVQWSIPSTSLVIGKPGLPWASVTEGMGTIVRRGSSSMDIE